MIDKKLGVLLEAADAEAAHSPARLQFRYFAAARAHFVSGLPAIAGGALQSFDASMRMFATTASGTKDALSSLVTCC